MVNEHSAEVLEPGRFEFLLGAVVGPVGGTLPSFDAHLGIMPRVQVGTRYDILSFALDTRIELLSAEENGVDVCLEGGVGTGFLPSPFYYGGVCVSKKYHGVTPYVHVRYMEPKIDLDEGEDVSFVGQLYVYAAEGFNRALQIFVGAEIELQRGVYLVPEAVWIPTMTDQDDRPYLAYNVGLRFRFGAGEPVPPAHFQEVAPVAPLE